MVEDFGIKYKRKEDELHLIHTLEEKFKTTQDWTGSLYISIIMNWDYKAGILDISMPGYLKEALHKFQHPTPSQSQHSPHQWNPLSYSSTSPQLAHQDPESPKLAPPESNTAKQAVGTFLYYASTVDTTMLVDLNSIAIE